MNEVKCYSAVGRLGRLLAVRLLPGQDVVKGVIGLVKANNFKSGTVTAIGSLRKATVVWPKSMDLTEDPKDIAVFYEMEGPVELGIGHGFFGMDEDDEVNIHIHGLIMDKDGNMRCGNLVPDSAPVLATVDMIIQEMCDLELVPTHDEVFKHKFLHPMTKEKTR